MNSTPKVISATEYDINNINNINNPANQVSLDIDRDELFKSASQAVAELIMYSLQANEEFRIMFINNIAEALLSNTDLNEVFYEKIKKCISDNEVNE